LNTTVKGLDDPNVRKALSLAIDRKALVENLIYGYRVAESMTPAFGDYRAPKSVDFDLELANKLLDEAGYKDRSKFPTLKFLSTSKESSRTITEAIQAMWKEHLGITISIENREWSSYLAAVLNMDYEISFGGWVGDYLDPTTFLFMWRKDGGNNRTGWSSTEFEALLDEAASKGDPQERLAILAKAEYRMMKDTPVIPIAWNARNYLLHPSVKGWYPLLLDNHPYKDIRLETDDSQK
jgi:oligopeptide transport system substrate-binding protein